MLTQAKKVLAGSLLIVTGVLGGVTTQAKAADAAMIGGGGTCTPHEVFYQQYVPGYYNSDGVWIRSHYETRSRMSTECNPSTLQYFAIRSGDWYTNANYSGDTTHVFQLDANTYRFINELGSEATGYLYGNEINVPAWNVTGWVHNDGQQIAWSNGTTWTRYGEQTFYAPPTRKPPFVFNLHL
jgi:hypothetical protein